MSQFYSTEPTLTGHVTLRTSTVPINISLYCKECPATTHTFLQNCINRYYEKLLVHHMMENFLVQMSRCHGGDRKWNNDHNKYEMSQITKRYREQLEMSPRMWFNH
mmetsp:Transcript_51350/g.61805  ORF Transcript_51350/g.61805 Transcript_51350/m.61805 type:complete len:106 (-) Transcript_51350:58-375(-)